MKITNLTILLAFLCLILIAGFTLWNIHAFMPVEATCHDEFDLINKCGCVPCNSKLIEYFKVEKQCIGWEEINFTLP